MTPKEKAKELVSKFELVDREHKYQDELNLFEAKQCALICVKNEYHSLREYLFNLRSSRVIESETVYLVRLRRLILEEEEVKKEIEAL